MTQNKAFSSGLIGLGPGLILLLGAIPLKALGFPVYLKAPILIWGCFFIFMSTALLEIPLMIYIIRNTAKGPKAHNRRMAYWLNSIFVFFAALYALPNILLVEFTQIWLGLLIGSTSFLRFACSLVYLKDQL